jgi:hypothetical protein
MQVVRSRSYRQREIRALVRLADGSARRRDRAAFDSYSGLPAEANALLARQRQVATRLRAGGPAISPGLLRKLDAAAGTRSHPRARPRAPWLALRPRPAFACAVLLVLAGLGGWRAIAGSAGSAPTIARIAMLADNPATGPAPRRNPVRPTLLREVFGGVTFPDYGARFGVRASGQRTDDIGGRTIETVYYRLRGGERVSYSVVSGAWLKPPPSAPTVTVAGIAIRSYTEHGLSFVTLVRQGRTCVLAGLVPARTMVALAAAPLLISTPARSQSLA